MIPKRDQLDRRVVARVLGDHIARSEDQFAQMWITRTAMVQQITVIRDIAEALGIGDREMSEYKTGTESYTWSVLCKTGISPEHSIDRLREELEFYKRHCEQANETMAMLQKALELAMNRIKELEDEKGD